MLGFLYCWQSVWLTYPSHSRLSQSPPLRQYFQAKTIKQPWDCLKPFSRSKFLKCDICMPFSVRTLPICILSWKPIVAKVQQCLEKSPRLKNLHFSKSDSPIDQWQNFKHLLKLEVVQSILTPEKVMSLGYSLGTWI